MSDLQRPLHVPNAPGISDPIAQALLRPLPLPQDGMELLCRLEKEGEETWVVGGAVRDHLLGKVVHDFDIATSAPPDRVAELLHEARILPTGLAHGTLTVFMHANTRPYEVTTFRREGPYGDGRRPDWIRFSRSLEEDCQRRDFRINALAWNPHRGYADPCDGLSDLRLGRIACIGEANERFAEDALRILRAMRLALQLGFSIENATAKAMREQAFRLRTLSAERIGTEIRALLNAAYFDAATLASQPEIGRILLAESEQEASAHLPASELVSLLEPAASLPPDCTLRLAALCLRGSAAGDGAALAKERLTRFCKRWRWSMDERRRVAKWIDLAAQAEEHVA